MCTGWPTAFVKFCGLLSDVADQSGLQQGVLTEDWRLQSDGVDLNVATLYMPCTHSHTHVLLC